MSRRKRVTTLWVILVVALATIAVACGSDPTATPRPAATATPTATPEPTATPTALPPGATPRPTATPVPTATPDTSFAARWEQLISDCQAEGEIVIIMGGSDSAVGRPMLQWFQENFGVQVIASTGSGSRNADRLLAERSRGRFTVDISQVGVGSTERLRGAGALAPVLPLLFHPEVIDRSTGWYLTEVYWSDRDKLYSLANTLRSSNIWDIFYNTDLISPEVAASITSYQDLLRPEFKGKIVTTGQSQSGGTTTMTRLFLTLGEDFLHQLYFDNDLQVVGADSDRELADGLAQGKWSIALGGGAEPDKLIELGLPVASITANRVMEEGLVTEVRGTLTAIDQPPHPACQQLFYNWRYSQEGMEIYQTLTLDPAPSPGLRSDVPQGRVPDQEWEQVQQVPRLAAEGKIAVLDQASEEWVTAQDTGRAIIVGWYNELGITLD